MPPRLFISQRAVDRWLAADQADLAGARLTLRSGGSLSLEPASLFVSVSGGTDALALLGKVKAAAAITALGGEAYMSSVIVGDTAYDVELGFLAAPSDAGALAALRKLDV